MYVFSNQGTKILLFFELCKFIYILFGYIKKKLYFCIMKTLLLLLLVQTLYGPIEGIERDSVTAYLGIPFAQAPVGELAFRAPQPPTPWDTVLLAQRGSKNCPQLQNKYSTRNTDPDCLYLNIFVPNTPTSLPPYSSTPLPPTPVILWFHGGGYTTGGAGRRFNDELINGIRKGDELMYELGLLARETNTIIVSCNYRLNVYGFLNLHDFSDRFDTNLGVRDQLQALRFVHDIIADFGGDTTNIVIMGQSAGAASVINLMALKEAQPLFAKAIAFSPCIEHFLSPEHSQQRAKRFMQKAGISPRYIDKLLTMSPERLEKIVKSFYMSTVISGDTRCPFAPWIDGDLFTDYPHLTVRECTKPLMITYTAEESLMFTQNIGHGLYPLYASLAKDYAKRNGLPEFKVKQGKDPYWKRFDETLTDYMFHTPIDAFVVAYQGPIAFYEYTYIPEEGKHLGCYHWSDMPVLFGWDYKTSPQSNPLTRQKGKEMRQIVKEFIYE